MRTESDGRRAAPLPEQSAEARTVSLESVSKTFGATKALSDVSIDFAGGLITGLLGENGAGKSTLFKILAGYYAPDPGARLVIDGTRSIDLPLHASTAASLGFAFVHQDLALAHSMTISENVCIGGMRTRSTGIIDWRRQARDVAQILAELGMDLAPSRKVGTLTQSERAVVAIARAMYARGQRSTRLLVLDEPTANLMNRERDTLFEAMRAAARAGTAVVFCTHRLDEVLEITDRVSVLRDGRLVQSCHTSEVQGERELIRAILGRDLERQFPVRKDMPERSDVVLRASGLGAPGVESLDLEVRAGEIVGITGIAGAGQDVIPDLLIGAVRATSGTLEVAGKPIKSPTPHRTAEAGLGMLPADRKVRGGLLTATVRENMTLASLDQFRRGGLINQGQERQFATEAVERYDVRPRDCVERPLASLSGGNQQKALLAKWVAKPRLRCLILHEPTQGIDVGAKRAVLEVIAKLADTGVGVVIVSSEHEELSQMCSRVLVVRSGRVAAELTDPDRHLIAETCLTSSPGPTAMAAR